MTISEMNSAGRSLDLFDVLMQAILTTMILLSPLALGSVAPWARSILFVSSIALLALWLLQAVYDGQLRVVKTYTWFFIPAFFLIVLFQLIPLPPVIIEYLSSGAWQIYANTIPGYPQTGEYRTLSLAPYATWSELTRVIILAIVLFVTANIFRIKQQVVLALFALLAVGMFQSLYGFYEQFSGNQHIFWLERAHHLNAVTGTFHNKNHFAGLLEMIAPLALGLLMVISVENAKTGRRPRLSGSDRSIGARIILLMSSDKVYKQVMVAALFIIMFVAILFSLSRAGIFSATASLLALILISRTREGLKTYTFLLLSILVLIIWLVIAIGSGLVIAGLEEAASGKDPSWLTRLNTMQSSLWYFRDFPLTGSGFGSFGMVFPKYQMEALNNFWVDYLHNDWLQVFCEVGLAGGVVMIAGGAIFILKTIKMTGNRKDIFSKWIATGSLLGVGAMLLHSFFDYNLYKITSNGILFSTILGLSFASANMPGGRGSSQSGYWRISLRAPAPRYGLTVFVVVMVCASVYNAYPAMVADIKYNRYLANSTALGKAHDYFFLKTKERASKTAAPLASDIYKNIEIYSSPSHKRSHAFLVYEPDNYIYRFAAALSRKNLADTIVYKKAIKNAESVLGADYYQMDPKGFNRMVGAFAINLKSSVDEERRPYLLEAKKFMQQAIDAAPAVAKYHMKLAELYTELDPASKGVVEYTDRAVYLAPNTPYIRYSAGLALLKVAENIKSVSGHDEIAQLAKEHFKHTLFTSPYYSKRVYPIIKSYFGDTQALLDVTPQTVTNYNILYYTLRKSGDWAHVLKCLDTLDNILTSYANRKVDASYTASAPNVSDKVYKKIGYDQSDLARKQLNTAKQRIEALEYLGRWEGRSSAVARYQTLLRKGMGMEVERARSLTSENLQSSAMKKYLQILQKDWSNRDALIDMAELAAWHTLEGDPESSTALDYLFRLIINNKKINSADYSRVVAIVDSLELASQSERIHAQFVKGAGALLAGNIKSGLKLLEPLVEKSEQWRQRHLIWHYLGMAYENVDEKQKAIAAYRKVIKLVPSHLPALTRLSRLGVDHDNNLAQLSHGARLDIDFGGRVVLVGLYIDQEPAGYKSLNALWLFNDRIIDGYAPTGKFSRSSSEFFSYFRTPFKKDGKAYRTDTPKSGELVVSKINLNKKFANAKRVHISIRMKDPPLLLPKGIMTDSGGDIVNLTIGQITDNQRAVLPADFK